MWAQIKNEDWSLVSDPFWVSNWPLRLWDFNKHYQFIGGAGGEGVGYLAPAALGAAIANKKHGRLSVSIQSDGDLMMANGVLWTAAHHRVPLLTVMHNNRAYHQEIMQLQRVANQHNRGVDIDKCKIGTGHREAQHRLRDAREKHGRAGRGADFRSERSERGDPAGNRGG